jgi:hypothetical protein
MKILTSVNINNIIQVRGRPAFSHDYYLSHPYFVHLICVKTDLALAVGGWDESMKISADVDFVYRILERSDFVAHIPRPLYRWRTHTSSAGHALSARAPEATLKALKRHVKKLSASAVVALGSQFNEYVVTWPDPGGKVLIVIPTKNKASLLRVCISSIERTCDTDQYQIMIIDHESDDPETLQLLAEMAERYKVVHYQGQFNYAKMNNLALDYAGGEFPFVLFLNNDIEALDKGLDRKNAEPRRAFGRRCGWPDVALRRRSDSARRGIGRLQWLGRPRSQIRRRLWPGGEKPWL